MTLFLRLFVRVEHSQALRQDAQELAHGERALGSSPL